MRFTKKFSHQTLARVGTVTLPLPHRIVAP